MYKCASGGKKRLKQESLRAIHHGIQGTGGKSSPTITTNHFCFLMSNTSPGTFFLAPTILAFVLLFFSSELPECSLGSRTRRRMSSFDSQILTKYFIRVEERIMNCTIWNNKKNQSRKSVWRNVWPFPVHSTSFKGHSQGKAGLFLLKRSQSQVANRTQVLITDLAKTWRWRQIADLKPVSWKPTVLAYCFGK